MSASPVGKTSYFNFDLKSQFVEAFKAQDTAVKAAIVFGGVIVAYSLVSSSFFGALAGAYIGTRLANNGTPEVIIAQLRQQTPVETA